AFTLRRLKPGRQTFIATKEGFAEGSLRDVEVTAGQQIRITMPAGCTIRGRVTGLEPAELALVTVTAAARGGTSMHSAVDRSGNYRIDGAAPGRVHLSARLNLGTTIRSARSVEIQVAAGETGQADLDFSGGATITGRVTRAGRPISGGAMVRFDRRPAGSSSSVVTSQDGTYIASGLEDGDYSVTVMNDQSVNLLTASYTVRGSGTFDIDLKSSTIRGRVIDTSSGEPVQEPRLQLRPEASAAMTTIRTAGGDSLGMFVFESVAPGRYSVIAEKQGYASRTEPLTITESSQDQIEIRMSPVEGVRVKLVDAADGKPVQGHVVVKDAQGRPVWTGGKAGSTPGDLQLFLEPGTYTATAQAPGYLTRDVLLTAPGSQTIALNRAGVIDIRSSSTNRRRLRIYDAGGRPYAFGSKGSVGPQAPIVVLPPAGLTLRNVPAGTYSIQLLGAKDAVVRTITVTVVAGQTSTIEI
ncbi:MAG: carboxypeptidase-like regulatory domain-containing protein, partial [Thermoanaerobaculia bacterium]